MPQLCSHYDFVLPDVKTLVDVHLDISQTDKGTVMDVLKFPDEVVKKQLQLKILPTGVELE